MHCRANKEPVVWRSLPQDHGQIYTNESKEYSYYIMAAVRGYKEQFSSRRLICHIFDICMTVAGVHPQTFPYKDLSSQTEVPENSLHICD